MQLHALESPTRREASIGLGVDLVNTWNTLHRDPEHLNEIEDLRRLWRVHGELELAKGLRERDLVAARTLRTNLRRAFEAPDERRAVDALNYVVRESEARPQLKGGRRNWHYAFESPTGDPVAELAMNTAMALLDVVRTRGWERFGLCSAPGCIGVYVDLSKNRSRKYCSQLCADRMNQAAYRRRQRRPAIPTPLLAAVAARRRALEAISSLPNSYDAAAFGGR